MLPTPGGSSRGEAPFPARSARGRAGPRSRLSATRAGLSARLHGRAGRGGGSRGGGSRSARPGGEWRIGEAAAAARPGPSARPGAGPRPEGSSSPAEAAPGGGGRLSGRRARGGCRARRVGAAALLAQVSACPEALTPLPRAGSCQPRPARLRPARALAETGGACGGGGERPKR